MGADRTELIEGRRRYLRAVISVAGLKNMAALAKRLEVTQSTLTNIRSGSRSASPDLVEKIRRLAPSVEGGSILGAEPNAPLQNPSDQEHPLGLGERLIQAQRERIQELLGLEEEQSKNIGEVARNFDAMDKDDIFVYLSAIRRPLEMDPDETMLKRSIANAILRQAFFLYLRPTRAYLRSVGDYTDVRAEFDHFRAKVLEMLPAEMLPADAPPSFGRQLILIQADGNPLFVVPDFKWELFYSERIDLPYKAIAGALIAAGHSPNFSGPNLRIPLSATATKRVLLEIARTICFASRNIEDSDQVPLDIVTRLKKSAEQATGEKVEEDIAG
jgi:transcriptional regulator with XRE-family HTH domain